MWPVLPFSMNLYSIDFPTGISCVKYKLQWVIWWVGASSHCFHFLFSVSIKDTRNNGKRHIIRGKLTISDEERWVSRWWRWSYWSSIRKLHRKSASGSDLNWRTGDHVHSKTSSKKLSGKRCFQTLENGFAQKMTMIWKQGVFFTLSMVRVSETFFNWRKTETLILILIFSNQLCSPYVSLWPIQGDCTRKVPWTQRRIISHYVKFLSKSILSVIGIWHERFSMHLQSKDNRLEPKNLNKTKKKGRNFIYLFDLWLPWICVFSF